MHASLHTSCGRDHTAPHQRYSDVVAPVPRTRYASHGDLDIAYPVLRDGPVDLLALIDTLPKEVVLAVLAAVRSAKTR